MVGSQRHRDFELRPSQSDAGHDGEDDSLREELKVRLDLNWWFILINYTHLVDNYTQFLPAMQRAGFYKGHRPLSDPYVS